VGIVLSIGLLTGLVAAAQATLIRGDFTGEAVVNAADLPGFRDAWKTAHSGGAVNPIADMDDNKVLDRRDAALFLSRMLQPGTFQVEWDPNTTVVDQAHIGLLKASDFDTRTYTFDYAGVHAAGLNMTPGRYLVICGVDLRKIATTQQVGSDLVVTTSDATISDVVANGTIAWDQPIEFSPDTVVVPAGVNGAWVRAAAVNPIKISMKIGDYTYKITISLDKTKATCTISVSRKVDKIGIEGTVSGFVENTRSKNRIDIANHKIQSYGHEMNHMTGELTVGVVAAASANDWLVLEFPVTIMKIPFLVGPIPCTVNIKAKFVVSGSVPVDGSVSVKAKFTYDSDVGFKYAGSTPTASFNVFGQDITKDTAQAGASGAVGANFGAGFPRVELSLGLGSAVGWVQTGFTVGGNFVIFPQPPCQTCQADFRADAGYSLGLLGILTIVDGSIKLFEYKKTLFSNCPGAQSAGLNGLDRPSGALADLGTDPVAEALSR
jgi:hypothetical protein